MTKAEEILRKEITLFEWGKKNDKQLITYEDALKAVNKAINYTHSCKSDSELLPSFLYKHEGGLYFKHLEDTDITEQWNEYLKTR